MSRVAVISGGRSSEREISLRSGEAVAGGLETAGHDNVAVKIYAPGDRSVVGDPVYL
jgi:D-alanine-D-alanine ligase-like ATP-grasp enzyme